MLQEIHHRMELVFEGRMVTDVVAAESAVAETTILTSGDDTGAGSSLVDHLAAVKKKPFEYFSTEVIGCPTSCICVCHRYLRLRSPERLQRICGVFFLELASLYMMGRSCTKKSCRKQSTSIARLTYFFPQWLLLRMVSATLWVPDLQACNLSLKVPRVVPEESEIFCRARLGDIQGIQSLLDRGLASIYDVGISTGASATTYAIDRYQIDTWRFLLAKGADPYLVNSSNQTTADIAWNKVFAGSAPPDCVAAIIDDFDGAEYLKVRKFPALHLIILGLVVGDLATQIQLTAEAGLDAYDWQGRTALSWAAAKGDADSVQMLLEHGADPNTASFNGSTPLMFASRARNPSCMELLLAAGARPDDLNSWGTNALAYAMRRLAEDVDGISFVRPLLKGGADPNYRCGTQAPLALEQAVLLGSADDVKTLCEFGARPPKRGEFDLIRSGVLKGDISLVRVLLKWFWSALDHKEKNKVSAVVRGLDSTEMMEMFKSSIAVRDDMAIGADGMSDLFFDAVESL
ncbi:ankyrin repeat-containing domain protein [Apiosordaria backusii]|uniref:Ankyrin repeat-containing domain protein n=1 Tax=Apiosordaria backusii TaxID=314023 RepID=A0AA39ZPS6_9PEZI|nr:ankyrin repeat-containing domain protein [Apiosordaria backusii]